MRASVGTEGLEGSIDVYYGCWVMPREDDVDDEVADEGDYGQDDTGEPEPKLEPSELSPETTEAVAAEF